MSISITNIKVRGIGNPTKKMTIFDQVEGEPLIPEVDYVDLTRYSGIFKEVSYNYQVDSGPIKFGKSLLKLEGTTAQECKENILAELELILSL